MGRPRSHRVRALAVLAFLVAVAYGDSLRNGFVFDDAIFVERDQRLESFAGVRRLFSEPLWGFTDKHGQRGIHQYYRPLQLVAPAASKILFGGAAWPVHLLSLVLHLAGTLMLYELLVRCAVRARAAASVPDRAATAAALLLAAVFAVHPANSEAVLWASDLAGLGATACILAALLLHDSRLRTALRAALVGALCLSATLFKESGVLAPALMALYDLLVRDRSRSGESGARRGLVADYATSALALAAYLALRRHALGGLLPGARNLELGAAELVINALALVPSYIRAFVWPFDLNMYHDFDVARSITDARVVLGAIVALGVAAAATACVRRAPVSAFGLAWVALAAAPWLIVRWPQLNAFAERYLYLPSVGLYIAAVAPLAAVLGRRPNACARQTAGADDASPPGSHPRPWQRLISSCAIIVIVAFVARDALRARDWRDELTIYTKTLTQSPRAELIRNNLALRYLDIGEPARGIPIQEELLRIHPDFPSGWHNLGLLMLAAGRQHDAREAFEKSAALEPDNAATALNLGYVYDLAGERDRAVEQYFLATMLDRDDAKAWYNLAVIALEEGQLTNARTAVAEVLSRSPADRAAQVLQQKIESAPAREPAPTEVTLQRCNAARAAAGAGRPRVAVAKLEAAAWLDERSALPHHYLANLRYLAGRHREAYEHEREALRRDPDNALYRANTAALQQLLERGRDSSASPSFR